MTDSHSTEWEIKAPVPPSSVMEALIAECKQQPIRQQKDAYYDTATRDLFVNGVFFRVREQQRLQIKYSSDTKDLRHLECTEQSFDLPLVQEDIKSLGLFFDQFIAGKTWANCSDFDAFINEYGLQSFVTIDKRRDGYLKPGVKIYLDEVENLGTFLEIEVTDTELQPHYMKLAEQFNIQRISTGYVELMLRKFEPNTYAKGRYLLTEDRNA